MNPPDAIIALASDHAGYQYKETIKRHLIAENYEVADFGVHSTEPADYPIYVRKAAQSVSAGECTHGIVFGGSGNGEAIVANKIRGVRCAVCWNVASARLAKEHNNANMIAIGQRLTGEQTVISIVKTWLAAEFMGGRHAVRIDMIVDMETFD